MSDEYVEKKHKRYKKGMPEFEGKTVKKCLSCRMTHEKEIRNRFFSIVTINDLSFLVENYHALGRKCVDLIKYGENKNFQWLHDLENDRENYFVVRGIKEKYSYPRRSSLATFSVEEIRKYCGLGKNLIIVSEESKRCYVKNCSKQTKSEKRRNQRSIGTKKKKEQRDVILQGV